MYRDEYERCPRCHVELIDAGAVRACTSCNGQWATHAGVMEVALTMSHPNRRRMSCVGHPRRDTLACPSWRTGTGTRRLHIVEAARGGRQSIWSGVTSV